MYKKAQQFQNIFTLLIILVGILFFTKPVLASYYVSNPANCPTDTGVGFVCAAPPSDNVICGSGSWACAGASTITKPVGTVTSVVAPLDLSLPAGYIVDCYATRDSVAPYCDNSGAGWCNASSTCYTTKHSTTRCVGNTWASEVDSSECGTCLSGYADCNPMSDGICESVVGVTPYNGYATSTHVAYGASGCSAVCVSGYMDCNNGGVPLDGGDGCEINIGGTCTVGGLTGVYSATCNGLAGNCIVPTQHFITGIEAVFSTTSPLLWGTQYGAGSLLQLTVNGSPSSTFVITNSGAVGIGTSTPASSAALEINSATGGLLLPRLSSGAIASPVPGLLIYNTANNKLSFYNAELSSWINLTDSNTTTAGAITGSGASNYLTRWLTNSEVTSSLIYVDDSGHMGIGTTDITDYTFNVLGTAKFTGDVSVTGTLFIAETSSVPLIWGIQYGAGNLLKLMKNGVTTSTFVITNTGAVGIGTSTPTASAALEINSSNGGLLLPRLTTSSISGAVAGLMIYDTNQNKLMYFNGTSWTDVGSGLGNNIFSGTNTFTSSTIFSSTSTFTGFTSLATTSISMLGIGTDNPWEMLTVYGGNAVIYNGYLFVGDGTNTTTISGSGTSTFPFGISMAYEGGALLVGTTTNTGTLKTRVIGKVGAQYYCDANGENCYDPTAGWYTPVSQMVSTTVTSTGSITTSTLVGYQAVNELCSERLSGSRLCTTDDILYLIKRGSISSWGTGGLDGYWIAAGPPGYLANTNDCTGFTSASNIVLGRWWRFDSNGGGEGWMTPCNMAKPIACCK